MFTVKSKTDVSTIQDDKLASFVYNLLLKYQPLERYRHLRPLWNRAWTWALKSMPGTVSTNIHGRRAVVDFGHAYALYARRFRTWNNPLVELVYQSYRAAGSPIVVIDVGAGVGDTVLLLESNCVGMVGRYVCVEGDDEFAAYVHQNLADLGKAHIHHAMLADKPGLIPGLVRTHAGSASAQAATHVHGTTLDLLLAERPIPPNGVLKIDVDGFDGRVLSGARGILSTSRPAVIFEWHPILCVEAGNDWLEHFEVLHENGYRRFIWFTKYGRFSHFMHDLDRPSIVRAAEVCLNGRHDDDWHYDVIALSENQPFSDVTLAETGFAKKRRSRY